MNINKDNKLLEENKKLKNKIKDLENEIIKLKNENKDMKKKLIIKIMKYKIIYYKLKILMKIKMKLHLLIQEKK